MFPLLTSFLMCPLKAQLPKPSTAFLSGVESLPPRTSHCSPMPGVRGKSVVGIATAQVWAFGILGMTLGHLEGPRISCPGSLKLLF